LNLFTTAPRFAAHQRRKQHGKPTDIQPRNGHLSLP
jgi:hypothetical protein